MKLQLIDTLKNKERKRLEKTIRKNDYKEYHELGGEFMERPAH